MKLSPVKLNSILNQYSKITEPAIKNLLTLCVDKRHKNIVEYPILTGGKRLRPALAILTCQLMGGKIKDVLYPAAGLEILHNYTLIVDDIIDNSTLRRNKPTAWVKFGKSVAECMAINYSCAVFQAANKSKENIKISELFAKTLKTIVDGEILDILFERAGRDSEPYIVKKRYHKITEKDYFEMISKKTAILFQTCCEIGGILGKASKKQLKSLRNFGFNMGITFQIQDDILDMFGKTKSFGKEVGKDIIERKGGNIIIMLALKELSHTDRLRLLGTMGKKELKKNDTNEIMKLILKTNSLQKAYLLEKKFADKTKENLKLLPKNKWNNVLEELTNLLIVRRK